jgi:hypothetical protein
MRVRQGPIAEASGQASPVLKARIIAPKACVTAGRW